MLSSHDVETCSPCHNFRIVSVKMRTTSHVSPSFSCLTQALYNSAWRPIESAALLLRSCMIPQRISSSFGADQSTSDPIAERFGAWSRTDSSIGRFIFRMLLKCCWKTLTETYTMHSFAPFWNPKSKSAGKKERSWPKTTPRKCEKRKRRNTNWLPRTSARRKAAEKKPRRKGFQRSLVVL